MMDTEWILVTLPFLGAHWQKGVLWCSKYLGTRDQQYNTGVWRYYGMGEFEFKNEADAVMFSLRWS